MARMNWGMVCSVPKGDDLTKLEGFGKWFTSNVVKYGIQINQLYNFTEEPAFITRLERCSKTGEGSKFMDKVYEGLCRDHPSVSFVLHILPRKNSPEFEKMKQLTCRLSFICQGVLLENELSKFGGADEASIFQNVNQYIARRFSQIVDFKHDKREVLMVVKKLVVPVKARIGRSFHADDLHSTVNTALHADKMMKLVQTQQDSKHFRNSAVICGLPEHFTTHQIASIFSSWPVASVLLTTRGSAFIDFFEPNGPYQAKTYFEENAFKDSETEVEYNLTICPIQSHQCVQPIASTKCSTKEKRVPFHDTTNTEPSQT